MNSEKYEVQNCSSGDEYAYILKLVQWPRAYAGHSVVAFPSIHDPQYMREGSL